MGELPMMVWLCSLLITGNKIQISGHSIPSTVSTRRLSDKRTSSNSSKLLSVKTRLRSSMTDLTVPTEDTGSVLNVPPNRTAISQKPHQKSSPKLQHGSPNSMSLNSCNEIVFNIIIEKSNLSLNNKLSIILIL